MTETYKHTPGPWVVGGPWPAVNVCYIDAENHWESIVELWKYTDGEAPAEVKANANLITASPEMFDALAPLANLYIAHLEHRPDDYPIYGSNNTIITVGDVRKARSTILRAQGKTFVSFGNIQTAKHQRKIK